MEHLQSILDGWGKGHLELFGLFVVFVNEKEVVLEVVLFDAVFELELQVAVTGEAAEFGEEFEGKAAEVVVDFLGLKLGRLKLINHHLKQPVNQLILNTLQEIVDLLSCRV